MRRDEFTLTVDNIDDDGETKPSIHIAFEGPGEDLRERLTDGEGNLLDADELDAAFRLQTPLEADDARGVVSVTNRVTGEFVLELNADAEDVLAFIHAARAYGKNRETDDRYHVTVAIDGEHFASYDKSTFLVYDADGGLLRGHSLIPSGVEL